MGKKKQNTTTTNTYQYLPQPENPHYQSALKLIDNYDGGAAGFREARGRNEREIKESGNDFFGANTPAYARDKIQQSRMFRNNADFGRNMAEAKQNEIGYKTSAYTSLGGATAPNLVQTGGTSNSVMSQNPLGMMAGNFMSAFGSGAGGALAA